MHGNPRGNIYELPGALMHDYYGLVLKTTVLMVLAVFLIVMIMMVVALAVAAAVVVINVTEKLFWGRHVYCKNCCL